MSTSSPNSNSGHPAENSTENGSQATSFVETALKLSGKSDEEARSTGAVDRADEQVEEMFAPKYQTVGSPVHRAVWEKTVPVDLFSANVKPADSQTQKVMSDSLELIRRKRDEGSLYDEKGKLTPQTLADLGAVGYWGLLVDREYGGSGASFVEFAKFLTRMATVEPTVAGLASVHGCIGAVDPLRTFGNPDQKKRYLPLLASGERLSAFALTEPCAGSDLTALRTKAELDGDSYVVNGEKLFITNAVPGRTVGLVCLIEGKPAVLIADLPAEENEHFQVVRYGLHALKQAHNNGLKFHNFRVPRENLLDPGQGDGLTIAYHGLNRGRIALCANAAGTMRVMLASMLPWGRYRKTYAAPIIERELVQRRIGSLAGLIVACDAIVEWGSWLLDEGYRGEMECIIAKIFGSEMQKHAAIELFMKTHGGRAFVHGHLFGDHVHEFLAPCIYEGEGEMLGMAFFKGLIKEHGKKYFEPIGYALQKAGIRKPNPLNPAHAWALRNAVVPYLKWRAQQAFGGWQRTVVPGSMPSSLQSHTQFACDSLQRSRMEIDALMTKFQLGLADRQCLMTELSGRIQKLVIMLTTCLYAARKNDDLVTAAADIACRELKQQITGRRPSGKYFKAVTHLGQRIANESFSALSDVEAPEILMRYDQP
mgnify:CR=1 FL=1